MSHEKLAAKMEKRYAKGGGVKAIDWSKVLQVILPLLSLCLPLLAKRHAKKFPEATKAQIMMRLEQDEQFDDLAQVDKRNVVSTAYDTLANASKDDLALAVLQRRANEIGHS